MPTLYTIGHSNRTLEEFLEILSNFSISRLVDIRSLPGSRMFPWFDKEKLSTSLAKKKIKYLHLKELGGRKKTHPDSINDAWENASFRGYADYMQTKEFYLALKQLNSFIKKDRTVIMCAEALPWRCHRSLVADAEIARGVKVLDIMSKTTLKEHQLTAFAKINKTTRPIRVYYPGKNQSFPSL